MPSHAPPSVHCSAAPTSVSVDTANLYQSRDVDMLARGYYSGTYAHFLRRHRYRIIEFHAERRV